MSKIRCPYCRSINTKITDGVREAKKGYRRRYECSNCKNRFTTLEEWCPDPSYSSLIPNAYRTVKLPTRSQYQIQKEEH